MPFALLLAALLQREAAGAPLDAAAIRDAIALGQSKGSIGFKLVAKGYTIGVLSTPFARVAAAARESKRLYKPFTAAEVTPEMTAPEIHVDTYPVVIQPTQYDSGDIASVEAVVIVPKGSKEASAAIRPLRTEPMRTVYSDKYGFEYEGSSINAVFPMAALRDGYEVRVVYSRRIGVIVAGCTECNAEIKLDKIR